MIKKNKIFSLIFFLPLIVFAQANGKDFGVSFNINYTTTSQLYLQPNSPDPIIRNSHQSINDITSYSFDIRYCLSEYLVVGIGSEYIKKTFDNNINLGGVRAEMNDGYKVIPIDISVYYLVPFSTEKFKFFMGGGIGFYIGEHIRELGDVTVSNESKKIGYGIQISVGMDYVAYKFLSFRGQLRFREPEFEMVSKYSDINVKYDGKSYILPTDTFASKVNIDGITFSLGAVLSF